MDRAHFTLAMPDDPDPLGRLETALAVQDDPPITLDRTPTAVVRIRVPDLGRDASQPRRAGA